MSRPHKKPCLTRVDEGSSDNIDEPPQIPRSPAASLTPPETGTTGPTPVFSGPRPGENAASSTQVEGGTTVSTSIYRGYILSRSGEHRRDYSSNDHINYYTSFQEWSERTKVPMEVLVKRYSPLELEAAQGLVSLSREPGAPIPAAPPPDVPQSQVPAVHPPSLNAEPPPTLPSPSAAPHRRPRPSVPRPGTHPIRPSPLRRATLAPSQTPEPASAPEEGPPEPSSSSSATVAVASGPDQSQKTTYKPVVSREKLLEEINSKEAEARRRNKTNRKTLNEYKLARDTVMTGTEVQDRCLACRRRGFPCFFPKDDTSTDAGTRDGTGAAVNASSSGSNGSGGGGAAAVDGSGGAAASGPGAQQGPKQRCAGCTFGHLGGCVQVPDDGLKDAEREWAVAQREKVEKARAARRAKGEKGDGGGDGGDDEGGAGDGDEEDMRE